MKLRHKQPLRNKLFRRELILTFTCLIILISMVSCTIFAVNSNNNTINRISSSNKMLLKQVGTTYDTIFRQISYAFYNTALFGTDITELFAAIGESHTNIVFDILNDLNRTNQYMDSVYFYYPPSDTVYSTIANTSHRMEDFFDQAVFHFPEGKDALTTPRTVAINQTNKLTYCSLITEVKRNGKIGYLVYNMRFSNMNYDIIYAQQKQFLINGAFYIVNTENKEVFYASDASSEFPDLSQTVYFPTFIENLLKINATVTDTYQSSYTDWTFICVMDGSGQQSNEQILSYLFVALLLTAFFLLIVVFLIIIKTKPLNPIFSEYDQFLMDDFLINGNRIPETFLKASHGGAGKENAALGYYQVITVEFEGGLSTQNICDSLQAVLDNELEFDKGTMLKGTAIIAKKTNICILLSLSRESESYQEIFDRAVMQIYHSLQLRWENGFYLGIGEIKYGLTQIPVSFNESLQVLKHKRVLGKKLLFYRQLTGRTQRYEYPAETVHQIANNLLVCDIEGAKLHLKEFFDYLFSDQILLEDNEFTNAIYEMQSDIKNILYTHTMLSCSSLNLMGKNLSVQEMLDYFFDAFEKIIENVKSFNQDKECQVESTILKYVEDNFTDMDFNLNCASDALGINRNRLREIIKKHTGRNFSDYVTYRRIEYAKQLLCDESLSIDAIAQAVGYRYGVYFIRVFKNTEGVTPGQYRKNILK